jgi:two-component system NtrC family sensor kinase
MQEMTGAEFFRRARQLRPNTVRVILSGFADTAAIIETVNEGEIYKFIPKPWRDEDLLAVMSGAVERRRQLVDSATVADGLVEKCRSIAKKNLLLRKSLAAALRDFELQEEALRSMEKILNEHCAAASGSAREKIQLQLSGCAPKALVREPKHAQGRPSAAVLL